MLNFTDSVIAAVSFLFFMILDIGVIQRAFDSGPNLWADPEEVFGSCSW